MLAAQPVRHIKHKIKSTNRHLCMYQPRSHDSKYLAKVEKNRVFISHADTFEVLRTYTCQSPVSALEWSPNSELILCSEAKTSSVEVFSLQDPAWHCVAQQGSGGLVSAFWCPDSLHFITASDFELYLTIWSLSGEDTFQIQYPKLPGKAGLSFSPCGRFLAVLHRENYCDSVSLYDTQTWSFLRSFPVATSDASSISWSRDGGCVVVVDDPLESSVAVHSITGRAMVS
jgi:WD40 repeat protein